MPADCARRIEGEMSRAIRQKKGETKFMKNEKNGQKQSWGFAVVLVCLVLVLSVGGVFLFLNASGAKNTPATPVGTEQLRQPSFQTEPPASTEANSFTLSETGKAFLEKMCYFMPDWSDDDSLNDEFWRSFLFSSFTCPEIADSGAAMTVCGEQELVTTPLGTGREGQPGGQRSSLRPPCSWSGNALLRPRHPGRERGANAILF